MNQEPRSFRTQKRKKVTVSNLGEETIKFWNRYRRCAMIFYKLFAFIKNDELYFFIRWYK